MKLVSALLAFWMAPVALACGTAAQTAHHSIALRIVQSPANTPSDAQLYVAGSFNGWNPADPACRLHAIGKSQYEVVVHLSEAQSTGTFKFTRGNWQTVEKDARGFDITDRLLSPANGTLQRFSVDNWADLAPPPAHTTVGNITRLADFAVPELDTNRGLWVALPADYATSDKRYPVLYMYDGQNLFDRLASAFGTEWEVDETLARLASTGELPGVIVVGLENSARRGCEYNVFAADPHPACSTGEALGPVTNAFVAQTLKPFIDQNYRTLADREHTWVAGASMGGQMALHLALSFPQLFSRAAAFSPSFQNSLNAPLLMPEFVRSLPDPLPLRLYLDMGSAETIRELTSERLVENLFQVDRALQSKMTKSENLWVRTIPGGIHHESAWAARFGEVLLWLARPE